MPATRFFASLRMTGASTASAFLACSPSTLSPHFHDLHHAAVLVLEDVAVEDELAREVEEAGAHRHLGEGRDRDGVLEPARLYRLAVHARYLEVVDMDVEWVPVVA